MEMGGGVWGAMDSFKRIARYAVNIGFRIGSRMGDYRIGGNRSHSESTYADRSLTMTDTASETNTVNEPRCICGTLAPSDEQSAAAFWDAHQGFDHMEQARLANAKRAAIMDAPERAAAAAKAEGVDIPALVAAEVAKQREAGGVIA
jgi:hypothetical protein